MRLKNFPLLFNGLLKFDWRATVRFRPFNSLRNKIFVLVTTVLVAVAIAVMITSRRNVTETVMASEQHAINNVLDLIRHELAARWSAMLDNKVAIVRSGRSQLMQTGKIIETTLGSYAKLATDGIVTTAVAQELAIDWINQLRFDDDRYAFAFDREYVVLASGNAAMTGHNLSAINDYKNRPLAKSVLAESRDSGYSFALYRRPAAIQPTEHTHHGRVLNDEHDDNSRYAYFGYFHPWEWVFSASDSGADVVDQIEEYRTQMEQSVRDTVLPLELTHSGFVFIVDDDGRFIAKPPNYHSDLLDGMLANGQSLRQRMDNDRHIDLHAARVNSTQGIWQINSRYYAPLRWTIVAAVPEEDLSAPARTLLHSQATIFGGMLLLTLLITWFFAARIVRPLRRLTRFARQLPDQALQPGNSVPNHIAILPERHNDEVGRLAAAFMYMDSRLRENISHLMRETTARERFESELNIARTIQLGLLPLPLSEAEQRHVDLHALMRPAKQVGGDLYDYFSLPNGKLCVVIGDVSDKGVPAALFMAITRTLIRATAEDETNPARIVNKVNDRLAENNPNMMFVTLIVGVLDLHSGEFVWVNAGHLEPIIINPRGVVRMLCGRSGPACGVQDGISYLTYRTHLQPGDMLIGYTDGVTESFNLDQEQYGEARMLNILTHPYISTTRLIQRLLQDVDTFAAGAEQADDITLLVIRRP